MVTLTQTVQSIIIQLISLLLMVQGGHYLLEGYLKHHYPNSIAILNGPVQDSADSLVDDYKKKC